ncbi:MAG: transposase [Bacteroidales bacterium]|jgi:REP element-mobilizing transposase RayT|nr:transposase [Bacteroidales bacterium]
MKYNPNIHHRRSIRLKGYDYSQKGLYFVTICVQNREYLFGKIANGKMILNAQGKMIEKWCSELSNKFCDIVLDTHIIMPNYIHIIIVNTGNNTVGADLRVCPDENPNMRVCPCPCPDENSTLRVCPDILGEHENNILGEHENNILGEHTGSPLQAVVQWLKTMTTNEYIRGVKTLGWKRFDGKLWQRNYWEHIIRNERAYLNILNYIEKNPAKWEKDKFYQNN